MDCQHFFGQFFGELLGSREVIQNYIVPKVDLNKTDIDNKVVHNLQTMPFATLDKIMSLSEAGYF